MECGKRCSLSRQIALPLPSPFQSALLGWAYLFKNDTETAKLQAGRTLELRPDGAMGLLVLGTAQQMAGEIDEAIATHERMAEVHPYLSWRLGVTYAQAGRTEDALAIARAMEAAPPNAFSAFGLMVLYGHLGDAENSYRWLTYEPGHAWRVSVATDDPIAGIPEEVRSDPRFDEFLARINLPSPEG